MIRPTPPEKSAYHKLPSGPTVMSSGIPYTGNVGNVDTAPAVVIRPIELSRLVNHNAPSGPVVRPESGRLQG